MLLGSTIGRTTRVYSVPVRGILLGSFVGRAPDEHDVLVVII